MGIFRSCLLLHRSLFRPAISVGNHPHHFGLGRCLRYFPGLYRIERSARREPRSRLEEGMGQQSIGTRSGFHWRKQMVVDGTTLDASLVHQPPRERSRQLRCRTVASLERLSPGPREAHFPPSVPSLLLHLCLGWILDVFGFQHSNFGFEAGRSRHRRYQHGKPIHSKEPKVCHWFATFVHLYELHCSLHHRRRFFVDRLWTHDGHGSRFQFDPGRFVCPFPQL
mmetsp:Transcript_5473/g.15852  ORF Transcript_5473/g.15852 Transcript_5473/m.15852 type:complete len:224 (+) Transcript_5473:550-1221(+)